MYVYVYVHICVFSLAVYVYVYVIIYINEYDGIDAPSTVLIIVQQHDLTYKYRSFVLFAFQGVTTSLGNPRGTGAMCDDQMTFCGNA